MNCREATRFLHAHADGELDLSASLAVEEHLEGCAACRRTLESLQAVHAAIIRHAATPRAPEPLRRIALEGPAPRGAWGRIAALFRSRAIVAAPGLVALALVGWLALAPAKPPVAHALRIVYHIASSQNAEAALRNLGNHLRASPEAKVIVVAHNDGVDFLLAGARDPSGHPFEALVRDYRQRGVEFRVCQNTLARRGIPGSRVIPEADLVPSGIAEIGRLQSQEGYAYMRL